MAIAGCLCKGELGNTGIPQGAGVFGKTTLVLHVPLVAKDGTRNKLDATSATLGDDLLAMINNTDPSKRAYPFINLTNVVQEQEDTQFETLSDGQEVFLRKGIRSISFDSVNVPKQYYAKAADACVEFGTYKIDICGNLEGELVGTDLYPRAVNKGSYDARYIEATDSASAKVMVAYKYKKTTDDNNQWYIGAEELKMSAGGYLDANQLRGLIDVNFEVSNITSTSIDVLCTTSYGTAAKRIPFTGAQLADFTLYNNTTDLPVTPTAVTESGVTEGLYTLEFAAQTASDVVEVDVFKAGVEGSSGFEGEETTFVAV